MNDYSTILMRIEQSVKSLDKKCLDKKYDGFIQVREMQKQVDTTVQNVNERVNRIERDTNSELRTIRREVDDKIKKALDNPLAN